MKTREDLFKKISAHCKEYGFVFPSSEIYDGLSSVYDYGPNGIELKNNIKRYWWESMTKLNNVVGLDSSIFMHPKIWDASGHVGSFNDPMIDNKDSNKRYRVDTLIEDWLDNQESSPKLESLRSQFTDLITVSDFSGLLELINNNDIVCPISNTCNWTEIRQFNLMFSTQLGSSEVSSLYLRPETAQGIFVNFLNVQKSCKMKIPFGIAQIGKAFRNEIVARQFIFRMREFEQMEMQFFIRPGEEAEWFERWKVIRLSWHKALGFDEGSYKFHDHDKLAHYATAATDIEFNFPFGFKEVEGIHSRTDFDLRNHQDYSTKKIQYFDPELNQNYIPYVIETSVGVDRMFLLIMSTAYKEEILSGGETRVVLKFPPELAPTKVAIMPLTKKDGLPEIAKEILEDLILDYKVTYDERDSIGKRYRRQDAIGTPLCITVDYQTKDNNTVTVRHRDTMEQVRVPITDLKNLVESTVSMTNLLKQLR